MPASPLSPFERLLVHTKPPFSVHIRLYHPTYSPTFPATHLLSFLPLSSKLSLRHLSPTTKAWIDSANPSVFSNLTIHFPLTIFSPEQLSALHNTSPQCQHLTVTIPQHPSPPKPSDVPPLPPFPRLTHLHLTALDHDPFPNLLSLRLALQSANIPLLTHLTLTNLSIPGILALRWGPFTAFGDAGWTGANIWHRLESLDVRATGWWDEAPQLQEHETQHHSILNADAEASETEPEKARRHKEDWRTGTRVLHDWLHSFAADASLRHFRFEWIGGEGPNPFLLDDIVARDGKKEWFSAPGIRWNGLREVWLGNIVVTVGDVRCLKERMAGLERIVVAPEFLDAGLGGRLLVDGDGRMWVQVDVEGESVGEWVEVWSEPVEAIRRGSYGEGLVGEDRKSMVLPFILDLSPEDGSLV
ncbi:hypothetical protein IMSHALPRED_009422 [Imshaugia aleurites]|uniref:Uncharacterized protein n=1 Tax=Imshaugia aleurites TaxID=172621 RepID=A0A8H3G2Y2_9LECA|nr:hypothetical protein IMSHALPRED_009422 [Imshaugia aleurites]